MRLFIAISPPEPVLAELASAVKPLQERAPDLRWSQPAAWHLTLAFLGETTVDVLPDLSRRLERAAARHPACTLAVAGGGAFPSARKARVLWAGLRADRRALAALAASTAAAARRAGAPPPDEGRAYRPHLTLARSQDPADVTALVAALATFAGQQWTAQRISLIRSHLGRGVPRYEHLSDWPLKSGT
jgi:RNA 2',3'-cyclic 3'-phosphodiesterase